MLNYLRAECYKVFHRKYFWVTLLVLLGLESLLVGGWVFINQNGAHVCFDEAVHMLSYVLVLGCYFTFLTGDMVFAGQYKNGTLKNEASFGLPRWRIYLGKLIAQLMTAVLLCFVILLYYVALSALVLPAGGTTSNIVALVELGRWLVYALPIWVGAQATVCACLFLIRGGTAAAITALALIAGSAPAVQVIGLMFGRYPFGQFLLEAYAWLPTVMLERAPIYASMGDGSYFCKLCMVGGMWFLGSTALGLWRFTRKEIN